MNDTYGRNKKPTTPTAGTDKEKEIRINGFQQVLDMLRVADPQFRESLLKRIQSRDQKLAHSLKKAL